MGLEPCHCVNPLHSCVPVHVHRETKHTQEDKDQEKEEEVTYSLLREGAGGGKNSDQEEEEDPTPLLNFSPSPHRAQSSLHNINLRVQQVSRPDGTTLEELKNISNLSLSAVVVHLFVCPG